MSKCRPITDTWILARPKLAGKVKRYGAYPAGFLERARAVLGMPLHRPLLHVCGGLAKLYPYPRGFGENDKTMDLDPDVTPDYLIDARKPWPLCEAVTFSASDEPPPSCRIECRWNKLETLWDGILCDPPYSERDAKEYPPGSARYPNPEMLLKRAAEVLAPGGKVGILHYIWVRPPKNLRSIGLYTVYVGFNNRPRAFSVFEKIA